jgi:hypothetical protein
LIENRILQAVFLSRIHHEDFNLPLFLMSYSLSSFIIRSHSFPVKRLCAGHGQFLFDPYHTFHAAPEDENIATSQPNPDPAFAYDDVMADNVNDTEACFRYRDISDVTGDTSSRRSFGIPASTFQSSKRSFISGGGGGGDSGGIGGGGGGSGRALCPKCGTRVTFQHPEFEENSFYCASCSGWFVINANTAIGKDSSVQIPNILMQKVSNFIF